jgi:hypothetical protein
MKLAARDLAMKELQPEIPGFLLGDAKQNRPRLLGADRSNST